MFKITKQLDFSHRSTVVFLQLRTTLTEVAKIAGLFVTSLVTFTFPPIFTFFIEAVLLAEKFRSS